MFLLAMGFYASLKCNARAKAEPRLQNVIKSVRDTLGLRTIDLLERIQALEQQVAKLSKVKKEGAGGYVD